MSDNPDYIAAGIEALHLLTTDQVAARLQVSFKTVRRLMMSGELESVKIGALRLIAPEAVIAYKEKLRREAAADKPPA